MVSGQILGALAPTGRVVPSHGTNGFAGVDFVFDGDLSDDLVVGRGHQVVDLHSVA